LTSREARAFTQETLDHWRVPMAYEVLHIVNELVTNAVVHTTGIVTLSLDLRGQLVRIVVTDESKALPADRAADKGSTRGRGLILAAAMSRTWGAHDGDRGKVIWADVAIQRAAAH
jgi:anti-sigma regulatory factor (Ser/Thr protein kinase)